MLSRVAESIYWTSRYVERAENVARFVDVNLHLMLDMPEFISEQWDALVKTTGEYESFAKRYPEATSDNVIEFLTFDRENPNSIVSCVFAARENAMSVREIISGETWEDLNEFFHTIRAEDARRQAREAPHDFFRSIRKSCHLFEGVMSETMARGEAWHFTRLGRLLERADQTTRILDVKYFLLLPSVSDVGTPVDDLHWSAVLRSASAFETYRQKHGRVSADHIAEFLILDREFPRSVHYCVMLAEESLHAITGTPPRRFRNTAERRLGQLVAELDYTDIGEVIASGLHEFLDDTQRQLNLIGDAIDETFFAPTAAR